MEQEIEQTMEQKEQEMDRKSEQIMEQKEQEKVTRPLTHEEVQYIIKKVNKYIPIDEQKMEVRSRSLNRMLSRMSIGEDDDLDSFTFAVVKYCKA